MIDKLGEDKQFIEIINTGTKDKPYYEIKYLDRITGKVHIGYSSYKLDVLSEFIREDFILSRKGHWMHFAQGDDCSECGYSTGKYESASNFCPNCGADMRGDTDDSN